MSGESAVGRRRIGVLTSGGDCPGLNACLRAIVRTAGRTGSTMLGIRRGWQGLLDGDTVPLDDRRVSGILHLGGTILQTARCPALATARGVTQAARALDALGLGGLIVLGGNGSLKAAWELSRRAHTPILGIPKSIDNDVGGTEVALGFDTAVNTALQAVDKIRDTATSHNRLFLVEVMGRASGHLALYVGLAAGAEEILIPETPTDVAAICRRLAAGRHRGKASSIFVIAEGDDAGGAFALAARLRRAARGEVVETRVSVLGHQQRGGSPTAADRVLAARLGRAAVLALRRGARGQMVGVRGGQVVVSDLAAAWREPPVLNRELVDVARELV